ncbi:hypothetical protein FHR38_004612 [Micromonospora polyrhachis]|uniref:Uncharacterized protein n=1 Tax=Micromonospora polyrhachis TaxID=1282883 RepID=A0A7W7STY4_9ACTN|nr:hypothetical protein [Micromonospora polyrhachis]
MGMIMSRWRLMSGGLAVAVVVTLEVGAGGVQA